MRKVAPSATAAAITARREARLKAARAFRAAREERETVTGKEGMACVFSNNKYSTSATA
jgi:hypothetical protein